MLIRCLCTAGTTLGDSTSVICSRYTVGFCDTAKRDDAHDYVADVRSRAAPFVRYDARLWCPQLQDDQRRRQSSLRQVSLEAAGWCQLTGVGRKPKDCW